MDSSKYVLLYRDTKLKRFLVWKWIFNLKLWFVVMVLLWSDNCLSQKAGAEQPNVVVFIADDLGWEDTSPYGNSVVHTPNIQNVADDGMRFNNFFLTASSCSPSRLSMLTGLYPHQTGAMNLHENISPNIEMLPDKLNEAGYYTMLIGKSHGTNDPRVQKKFQAFQKADWGKPWIMGDDWVKALNDRPKDRPFFLWAASIDPHRPFEQGEYPYKHDPKKVIVPPYHPDIPEIRKELADYYDEISRFDQHIGMAIAELKRQKVLNNTIIIVLSDNGKAFPQAKTRVNVPGLKSPLIIRYPKMIEKGSRSTALVSAVDLSPTILDLVGAKSLDQSEGRSFKEVFLKPLSKFRDFAFAEHNWHSNRAYERTVISPNFLYIKNWLPELPATPPGDVVRVPSYQAMQTAYRQGKLDAIFSDSFIAPRPVEELFELTSDLACINNLVSKQEHQQALSTMRTSLAKHLFKTGDIFPGRNLLKPDLIDRITGEKLTTSNN